MTKRRASRVRVAVGLSGGVDSAVAAALLKEKGFQVIGVIMKIWHPKYSERYGITSNSRKHACFGPEEEDDIRDAKEVCDRLGIPLIVLDLSSEYEKIVINYFKREYLVGRTPNPCAICNCYLKFGLIPKYLKLNGIDFDFFATGHYAICEYNTKYKRKVLMRAVDREKDQSYMISLISRRLLDVLILPLGSKTKKWVRNYAKRLGLPVAYKRESQDFISDDYSKLFKTKKPGPIFYKDGTLIGFHDGLHRYTIGQRRRLKLFKIPRGASTPLYVIDKDPNKNALIVGEEKDLYSNLFTLKNINWLLYDTPPDTLEALVKVRYRSKSVPAKLRVTDDKVIVECKQPQRAVTPGQLAVFYTRDDIVIGAGIIDQVLN